MARPHRAHGKSTGLSGYGGQTHVTDPAHVACTVEAVDRQPVCPNLHRSGGDAGVEVVGKPQEPRRQFLQPDPSMTIVRDASKEGCGGPHVRLGDLGSMVSGMDQMPHEMFGAPSGVVGWCGCECPVRQLFYSCVLQQGRRDAVPLLVPPGSASLGVV